MIHLFKNAQDVNLQVELGTVEKIEVDGSDPKGIIGLVLGPYTIKVKASTKLVQTVLKDAGLKAVPVENVGAAPADGGGDAAPTDDEPGGAPDNSDPVI